MLATLGPHRVLIELEAPPSVRVAASSEPVESSSPDTLRNLEGWLVPLKAIGNLDYSEAIAVPWRTGKR